MGLEASGVCDVKPLGQILGVGGPEEAERGKGGWKEGMDPCSQPPSIPRAVHPCRCGWLKGPRAEVVATALQWLGDPHLPPFNLNPALEQRVWRGWDSCTCHWCFC